MLNLRSIAWALSVSVLTLTLPAPGQVNTSTIAGVVTDQTKSAVANAKITATTNPVVKAFEFGLGVICTYTKPG